MLSFAKGTADHRDNASSKQTWPLPDLLIILDCAAKQASHWQQSASMGKAGSISGGGRDTDARGKGTGSTILYRPYSAVVPQPQLEVPHICKSLKIASTYSCQHHAKLSLTSVPSSQEQQAQDEDEQTAGGK